MKVDEAFPRHTDKNYAELLALAKTPNNEQTRSALTQHLGWIEEIVEDFPPPSKEQRWRIEVAASRLRAVLRGAWESPPSAISKMLSDLEKLEQWARQPRRRGRRQEIIKQQAVNWALNFCHIHASEKPSSTNWFIQFAEKFYYIATGREIDGDGLCYYARKAFRRAERQ